MSRLTLRCLNWTPLIAAVAVGVATFLSGCALAPEWRDGALRPAQPPHVPVNHLGVLQLPPELRRVVLLPVSGGGLIDPEAAVILDQVFLAALQRQLRFEVVPVSREWCRRYFQAGEFSTAAVLPHDFLARVAGDHGADGVLFVDVTAYRDHRPLTIGMRAKLALVAGPRVIWSYDELLSTEDPAVAAGAQDFIRAGGRAGLPVDLGASALQSPSRFAAYVADTAFRTLPPR